MMNPKQIFETGLQYHHYANTAYPLTPTSLKEFRIKDQSEYLDFLKSEWSKTDELSLYVHIPFCKVRCKFCEYVVLDSSDSPVEDEYVSLLIKEIEIYKEILNGKRIVGYDLGGGTPTKLSNENLQLITSTLQSSFNFDENVVFSIETTPIIAAQEPEKIKAVYDMGYRRISMGIQTISERLLNDLGREGTTHIYEIAVENIRKAGYTMFNVDLMYGFLYQSDEDFENTIRYAIALNPEFITLYRNRYKGTKLEGESGGVSLYKIIHQYRIAYRILLENGYEGNPGKNTFSKIENNYGTSDYLTKRVVDGVPYVGMGLGAQSFGMDYLAYNSGAANKKLNVYKEKIEKGLLPIQDIYALDQEEVIAKMISVAFYFGFIDLDAFYKRFKLSFIDYFKEEVEFVISEGLMELKGQRLYLTSRGSDYINGIIPLFYSKRSKKELKTLQASNTNLSTGEKEFLKAYDLKAFDRPSLTSDIIIFTEDQATKSYSVVLIKRGEHPFMNDWALPGGFVKNGETAEDTAYRELIEETSIEDIPLSQIYFESQPKRDPRGWIVSCVFAGLTQKEKLKLQYGDDAINIGLFSINTEVKEITDTKKGKLENIHLQLKHETTILEAEIEKESLDTPIGKKRVYKVLTSNGIAFDHASMILRGIEVLDNI